MDQPVDLSTLGSGEAQDGPVNERDVTPEQYDTPPGTIVTVKGPNFVVEGRGDIKFHPKGVFATGYFTDAKTKSRDILFFDNAIQHIEFDFSSVLGEE